MTDSRIQRLTDLDEISTLLGACALPVSDLTGDKNTSFFGIREDGALAAVVGLETYPPVALLRSLAVAPKGRGRGLGTALVAFAEDHARETGVAQLYLLTTTAAGLFLKLGYAVADRADTPSAIRSTAQFAGLCPDSADFMVKRLA